VPVMDFGGLGLSSPSNAEDNDRLNKEEQGLQLVLMLGPRVG